MANINSNILLSIIVPVYNTQLYLSRCIDSLLNDEHKFYEVILVNDGSTDDSAAILDAYVLKDPRIRVLHKLNGGLSSARNAGLIASLGEYVGFIDSDDYVSTAYITEFFDAVKFNQPDIIIGGRYSDINGEIKTEYNLEPGFLSISEVLNRILIRQNIDGSVCDKIFRRALFEGVSFRLGVHAEDIPVLINVVQKANTIYHLGKEVYFYYRRGGSITTNPFSNKMISVLQSMKDVCETVKIELVDMKKLDFFVILYVSRFYVRFFTLSKLNRAQLKVFMRYYLGNVSLLRIWANEYLLWRDKLLMTLAKMILT
jgi:glycosyltransferase involved in cell wall biosynthesis